MKCRKTFHSQQQMTDENDISLSFLIPYIQKKFGKFTWGLGNDDPLTWVKYTMSMYNIYKFLEKLSLSLSCTLEGSHAVTELQFHFMAIKERIWQEKTMDCIILACFCASLACSGQFLQFHRGRVLFNLVDFRALMAMTKHHIQGVKTLPGFDPRQFWLSF